MFCLFMINAYLCAPKNGMMIVVEEKLNHVAYADGQEGMPKIKDRLSIELHSDRWDMPLPDSWDYEIYDELSTTTIHIQGIEPPFIVEGPDYLYYVLSRNCVNSVAKEVLFAEAIKHAIGEDVINMARLNGYDISDSKHNERIFRAAALILNCANKYEECAFRIPYLLDKNYDIIRENPDYNAIPDYYKIDENWCTAIVDELTTSIKKDIRFDNKDGIVTLYSYNWFISKIQLS